MTSEERIARIRAGMRNEALDVIVAVHDGAHFIETPDPVMILSGFRGLGPRAVVLPRDGEITLIVTPAFDAARAAEPGGTMRVHPADDVVDGLVAVLASIAAKSIAVAGLSELRWSIGSRVATLLPNAGSADSLVYDAARRKTEAELANAREAARIAIIGYQKMLELIRPGISEDDLAIAVRQHTKSLGADDNFTLLSSGPHNKGVAPSNGRRIMSGDMIVAEITPSYRGQLVQICRTIVVGKASDTLREKYALVNTAMLAGFAVARPGATMADICVAINDVLSAAGYEEYCYPPHIRRRGHGLGFGSIQPGDVALDNTTRLEPGMLFMIHPNQYLPETGYLLCGEPALITADGVQSLTGHQVELAEILI